MFKVGDRVLVRSEQSGRPRYSGRLLELAGGGQYARVRYYGDEWVRTSCLVPLEDAGVSVEFILWSAALTAVVILAAIVAGVTLL